MSRQLRSPILLFVIVIVLVIVLHYAEIRDKLRVNLVALVAQSSKISSGPYFQANQNQTNLSSEKECSEYWFVGFIKDAQGDQAKRNEYWGYAVQCDPRLVNYLFNRYPEDLRLAEFIFRNQPGAAASWFWMGELDTQNQLYDYQQGLKLDPTNGRRWFEVGVLLENKGDLEEALQAYLQSCYNGDPGYNGCWRAGKTAERLGDLESAIQYYHLSKWKTALDRAKELELQIAVP